MLRKMLWVNKTKWAWGWRKRVNEGLMICSQVNYVLSWDAMKEDGRSGHVKWKRRIT